MWYCKTPGGTFGCSNVPIERHDRISPEQELVKNKHYGRGALACEIFLVLSLAKPGVDAMRVASGAERLARPPPLHHGNPKPAL